jgi:cleavage and polyadenylation specificity factor subunit 1
MQCYTELLPPTGVTHSLTLPFLSATSKNLIVAKTSLLQIFSVNSKSKLVLVTEQHLSGTITALGRVKPLKSKSGGEALLVALRDAKLSLVEWDPERHGITTISIHYYEGDDLQTNPFAPELSQCHTILTVDPSSRCAALKFGARNLAILPFHQPGDDLVMDDYDPDIDGEPPEPLSKTTNGDSEGVTTTTPYTSSFVLPLSALDPSIIYPIHLAFLHEYREPTFGILYSQVASASSLLHEQKDMLSYSVFTLDLEQRASTTLLSVSRLPNDLYKVISLPLPVGGAMLVGGNELVHVDQGGKTNSIGVNEFARQNSSFSMADQSDLDMKLERCTIEQFGTDSADMLIGLNTGELAVLNVRLDGRSVSGISVRRVPYENGGGLLQAGTASSALLANGLLFFGSEEADSLLLTWNSRAGQLRRQKSAAGQPTLESHEGLEENDDMDDYDDDLYSSTADGITQTQSAAPSPSTPGAEYSFRVADRLPTLGPLGDIAVGRPKSYSKVEQKHNLDVTADLELVIPSGSGESGGVVVLKREIDPLVLSESTLAAAEGLWTVSAKSNHTAKATNGTSGIKTDYNQFLIVSKSNDSGDGQSAAYRLTETGLEGLNGTEFEPDAGSTINVGTLANSTRVVQALRSEVRSYDSGELPIRAQEMKVDLLTTMFKSLAWPKSTRCWTKTRVLSQKF